MQRIICVLILLVLPQFSAADDDVQKELKAIQGKWKTASVEAGGKEFPKNAFPDFSFVADADGKATGKMGKEEFRFTMTVNPKKDPKTIENAHETGMHKGKTQYGVYKLEGDKFTVCISQAGATEADRPKDFATKGNNNVVFVFERVKEDKKSEKK